MNLYYVYDSRSPFMVQDLKLLEESHTVRQFDLSIHARSFWQVFAFAFAVLSESYRVAESDVIWIWFADYPAVPFVLMAKLFGKPAVVNIGGYEVCDMPEINYGNQRKWIRGAVSRWILNNSSVIITQSDAYADKVCNLTLPSTAMVVCIPPYIDTNLCNGNLPDKRGVVTSAMFGADPMLKGLPFFEIARLQISQKSKVLRDLPRDEYISELKKAKVYCQISYTEQFNVTTLEAMACGCVPVVTDRDGLPDTAGGTGVIVPYGDVAATTAAIKKALTMDGTPARNHARLFTKERKAKRIAQLLKAMT